MEFTDLIFLFVFLPILLVFYYFVKPQHRKVLLIVFSLIFYMCNSPSFLVFLIFSMMVDVSIAKLIIKTREREKTARALFILGIVFNLGTLGYYKYSDFVILNVNRLLGTDFSLRNLLLPLGLSFFVFKAISYLSDVYRGTINDVDCTQTFLYLSFFGEIQSGPISRYESFNYANVSRENICNGVVRFMIGFSKKVMLANVLSNITIEIFDETNTFSTSLVWLGSICYSLQLYYDFSGYSDMAIGICTMLGFECPENFNYPYATKSIAEFWRRWHITLGAWFRDYIYIPMGGSRVGKPRLYLNLFVVWILTGIWHGAGWTFIVWGLGCFILIAFEKATRIPERLPKVLKVFYRIFTLLFINFQWVLFRSNDLSQGILLIKTMCSRVVSESSSARALFFVKDYSFYIILSLIFAMPIVPKLKKICAKNSVGKIIYDVVTAVFIIGAFFVSLSFVVSGQNSPFLYANF